MGAAIGQPRDGAVIGGDDLFDAVVKIRKGVADGLHVAEKAVLPVHL